MFGIEKGSLFYLVTRCGNCVSHRLDRQSTESTSYNLGQIVLENAKNKKLYS